MAANKRLPSRRPKTVKDLASKPPSDQRSRLQERTLNLREEIHRLECIVTAAPRMARQRRLARIDMVPPHDVETPGSREQHADRLPLQHQIALKRRRFLLLAELAVVGVGIAGIAGWLNQVLHFLR